MKAQPFKQATTTAYPKPVHSPELAEALAKHAASRPPRTPPKELSVPPTLPRMPKPHRRRRSAQGK